MKQITFRAKRQVVCRHKVGQIRATGAMSYADVDTLGY